ncbi:MAG TPA: universal stress protein [Chitinophagaceae bacterium]|nr:universal stress protein [Chitinophagaceae bacterium]
MEKILLAVDAAQPSISALDFACYLGRLTKSPVTAVFLDNLAAALPVKHEMLAGESEPDEMKQHAEAAVKAEASMQLIREGCVNREVGYSFHRHHGVPVDEMLAESRFADVLVVDAETSFREHFEGPPTDFVKDLLKKAECPVFIAPQSLEAVEELVFAYNGSASCMFAIKQFTYLFPQLAGKKATIVMINDSGKWEDVHKHSLSEWLKAHYNELHWVVREGDSDASLFEYLFGRKKSLLVMGAYGRNALSRFFKRSTASLLIKTIAQPIFITH